MNALFSPAFFLRLLTTCFVFSLLGSGKVLAQQAASDASAPLITMPTAGVPAAQGFPSTSTASASGQPQPWRLNIGFDGAGKPGDVSVAIQIVVLMTLLTFAPAMIMLMTSFTRIVIVLGFVRTAMGVPSAPSNQIIIGLSLFLTFFIMGPTIDRIHVEAVKPYMEGRMDSGTALEKGSVPLREFMLKQTRTRDLEFFLQLGRFPPTRMQDLPMRVVIPSFVISELQTAFQMGFLLFLPFLVVDFIVSSVLMSLGMMMMPPSVVSLPFKLLLFVLVDGWHLVVKSVVESFR
jgi:flagellar biosynthetic protein FliP